MTMRAGVSAVQNTALSCEELAALEADLGRLNGLAPGLGDRAVRYIAEGTDTSVLMEINGIDPAALEPFTHYHGVRYVERKELRRRALVDVQEWRPAVIHRFAVLMETMQNRAGRHRHGKIDPEAPHIHSCSENKGVLGLTMRAPGPDAGALVRRYLKEHGNKVNQSKALLTALARNPSPAAIQVVLSAANRLKQKTVQALAKELIDGIAQRRGWSADELADRTIPTAGFDEAGEMGLDCGEGRLFRAVYRGDGKIDLLNADGKVVKALPAACGEEDKEVVADSKKALTNARKEVKQVEAMQSQRLYEAMCVERTWAPETWVTCLQRHPIAGRLCQRLVWLALDGEGRTLASFRALEDGTLTSNADDTVELAMAAAIKLAHQALLPPADAEAWVQHLQDYEVEPLFPQFGKALQSAQGDARKATAIEDRKGWTIDSFKLQSATAKLGYERGEVYDGGGFSEYVKRFDGVGPRAVIEFSGSYVGANESFPCALIGLSFQRIAAQGRRVGRALRLSEVPTVLLSEAWGDLHAIAAAGSGFDQDWEKERYF